jgi:4'-phosphopantetheinyl transferase EntD
MPPPTSADLTIEGTQRRAPVPPYWSQLTSRALDLLDQIEAALRALAPPSVVSGTRRVDASDERGLFPGELAAVRRAAPSRRRQFATGRTLLRQLLRSNVPIAVAPDRRPLLPAGIVASLAHDDDVAVAVVSSDRGIAALGIDIEAVRAFDEALAMHILRPDDETSDMALAFVVKEAAYKSWSSPGRPVLDHHDVRLTRKDDVLIVATVVPTGERIPVQAVHVAGRWLALAVRQVD